MTIDTASISQNSSLLVTRPQVSESSVEGRDYVCIDIKELNTLKNRIESLETRLDKVDERNLRVETKKSFESSWARRGTIILLTYGVATGFLALIGANSPPAYLTALVPTGGYFLSILDGGQKIADCWKRGFNTSSSLETKTSAVL